VANLDRLNYVIKTKQGLPLLSALLHIAVG